MAPSRPDMIFPGCPNCGADVESTFLTEGVRIVREPDTIAPNLSVEARADSIPDGWQAAPELGGAPDFDVLALRPCGHELQGDAVHLFNLAALNLTHPDLVVEVRVTIPAAANYPERRQPRIVTKTGTYSAAGLDDQVDADRYIAGRIFDAADATIGMLGLIGVPADRVELLNATVFEALGAASMCWEGGTGDAVFDSGRCADIGVALLTKLGIPIAPNYRRDGSTCAGTGCTCATVDRREVRHAGDPTTPVRVLLDPYPVMGEHV